MSEKKDEPVPAYLPDVLAAIELLQTGGAHHRYYDEVCNAVAEIERLRVLEAEIERLRAENADLHETVKSFRMALAAARDGIRLQAGTMTPGTGGTT